MRGQSTDPTEARYARAGIGGHRPSVGGDSPHAGDLPGAIASHRRAIEIPDFARLTGIKLGHVG